MLKSNLCEMRFIHTLFQSPTCQTSKDGYVNMYTSMIGAHVFGLGELHLNF
jgi:hypothetical protein